MKEGSKEMIRRPFIVAAVAVVVLAVVVFWSALIPRPSAVMVPVGLDDQAGCAVWVQPADATQGYFLTLNGEAGSIVCAESPR